MNLCKVTKQKISLFSLFPSNIIYNKIGIIAAVYMRDTMKY